jgi:hypothetical protein
VNFGTTGLGESSTNEIGTSYSSWRTALSNAASANQGNPFLVAAAASLPPSDPIGGGTVYLTTANARVLGFTANTSVDSTLTFSNSVNFEYNGVPNSNSYDFLDVAAHELDEALGIGSALTGLPDNAAIPTDGYEAEDYFRYSAAGTRGITTNPSAFVYFSYDGGNTNVAQFNQAYSALGASDLDRNDWIYSNSGCPAAIVRVQSALLCDGQAVATGSGPEITVLNSLGYTEPVTAQMFPTVFIDAPTANATLSGTAAIGGWTIENIGTVGPNAISSVKVFVDGTQVGTATYGNSRTDVCSAYPGRVGCPNVGWNYSLNVAALTAGSHTLKITATDSAGNAASSQVTFTAAAILPSLNIESPAVNAILSGTVAIGGWAIENTATVGANAVSSVKVFADNTQVGTATYGISRPDVCAAYPGRPGCPNVGWSYSLNMTNFTTGSHTLKITAVDSAGNSSSSQVTFTAVPLLPDVNIEGPSANAALSGTVAIGGWAIENTAAVGPNAITSVTVQVDGSQVGTATYGISRTDVCAAFPSRVGCPNVGWSYSLNAGAFSLGAHTLKIVATDSAGNSGFSGRSFTVTTPPPFVFIEKPAANATLSGTAAIGGWALENTGTVGPAAVSSVAVFVDGAQVGTATYGIARADVCGVFPGRLGCPNVGWSYLLNTSGLASGGHMLKVVATDTASNSSFSQITFVK